MIGQPTLKAVPPSWGFDCNTPITPELAAKIAGTPMPNGQPVRFVFRYVSRHEPFSPNDITKQEANAIISNGLILLLVQHAQYPGLPVNLENGVALGKTAAAHAKSIGYPTGAHVAFDLEGVGDSGQPVIDCLRAWSAEVDDAGYKTLLYVGYQTGLTPEQLSRLDFIDGFWCDFAKRVPPAQGFMCHQSPQVEYKLGFPIDPDHAYPDLKGRCLMGMALDLEALITPPGDMTDPFSGEPFL